MRIGISLTGADEQTPLEGLRHLSNRRGVEVGLLFTATPEGRNRYPSEEWLEAAVAMLGQRAAVHVCGSTARERVLAGTVPWVRTLSRAVLPQT